MPFGNGVSYNKPASDGPLKGILKDAAVGCYFLPDGNIEPVYFKTELENGEIGTFKIQRINKRENKRYDGKVTHEFLCTIQIYNGYQNIRLVFFPFECLWKLVM